MNNSTLIQATGTCVLVGGVYFVLNRKINNVTERFQTTLDSVDTNDKLVKELAEKVKTQQEKMDAQQAKIESLEKIIVGHANFLVGLARYVEYPPVAQTPPQPSVSPLPTPEKTSLNTETPKTTEETKDKVPPKVTPAEKKQTATTEKTQPPKKEPAKKERETDDEEIPSDVEAQIQKALEEEIAKLDSTPRVSSSPSENSTLRPKKNLAEESDSKIETVSSDSGEERKSHARKAVRKAREKDSGSEPESIEIFVNTGSGRTPASHESEARREVEKKKVVEVDPPTRKVARKRMVNGRPVKSQQI